MQSQWFKWLHTSGTIVITLPGGVPILSLWLPNLPVTGITVSNTSGVFYTTSTTGAETIPIPPGNTSLTLGGISGSADLYVFATTQSFKPFKETNV